MGGFIRKHTATNMIYNGFRNIRNAISCLMKPPAQINLFHMGKEIAVEPSQLVIYFRPHKQACAGGPIVGIGIGATVAVFSAIDAALLRPLPYRHPERLVRIYEQMPEPKFVVAVGSCALSGGVFQGCYNVMGGIDQVIPVDAFIPGCPPRPEAIIDGVVKLLSSLASPTTQGLPIVAVPEKAVA